MVARASSSISAQLPRTTRLPRTAIIWAAPYRPVSASARTLSTAPPASCLARGYAAQVDGMVRRFRKELGEGARAIATGGLAGLICAETTEVEKVDPWLTLDGLRLIWGKTMNAE
jgi:type III pantothenate kinase